MFFAADAQYRAAGSAYEAENYGEWVARLRYADSQLKQIAAKGNAIDVRVGLICSCNVFLSLLMWVGAVDFCAASCEGS